MKEVKKLLKMVSEGLKTLAQGVEAMAEKVDDGAKTKSAAAGKSKEQPVSLKSFQSERKAAKEAKKPTSKPAPKSAPKPAKVKAAKPASAMDTVLNIIGTSNTGINTAAIREKSGYEQKKVSNIVYKLKKQGKIKAVKKGLYVKS
jgi:hypothetical protein